MFSAIDIAAFLACPHLTPEKAPSGLEFLDSLNRLNVAVSKAQAVAVVIATLALFQAECKSLHQMQSPNALCRCAEMAEGAL